MVMYTGNLTPDMENMLRGLFGRQEAMENASKFPPYTKVRFNGKLDDLLPYVSEPDEAKAILFDGDEGVVLGCNDFTEGRFYTVDFGEVGYHTFAIPEKLLTRI